MGSPGLIFKIDAIDGKKWVRATLIYDLNTIKRTAESYLAPLRQSKSSFKAIHMKMYSA